MVFLSFLDIYSSHCAVWCAIPALSLPAHSPLPIPCIRALINTCLNSTLRSGTTDSCLIFFFCKFQIKCKFRLELSRGEEHAQFTFSLPIFHQYQYGESGGGIRHSEERKESKKPHTWVLSSWFFFFSSVFGLSIYRCSLSWGPLSSFTPKCWNPIQDIKGSLS